MCEYFLGVLRFNVRVICRIKRCGREHVGREGPVVRCCGYVSFDFIDVVVVLSGNFFKLVVVDFFPLLRRFL